MTVWPGQLRVKKPFLSGAIFIRFGLQGNPQQVAHFQQVNMEFLWILAGILAGSLRDLCGSLAGSLQEPCGILAGSLRNPCGIVSPPISHYLQLSPTIPDSLKLWKCVNNEVFLHILVIWAAVKSPTISHYFSCKDLARIPQGSHKDPARIPQDPARTRVGFHVFLQDL